jgi:hypothetical protein
MGVICVNTELLRETATGSTGLHVTAEEIESAGVNIQRISNNVDTVFRSKYTLTLQEAMQRLSTRIQKHAESMNSVGTLFAGLADTYETAEKELVDELNSR